MNSQISEKTPEMFRLKSPDSVSIRLPLLSLVVILLLSGVFPFSSASGAPCRLAKGNQTTVVLAETGTILASSNGVDWVPANQQTPGEFKAVAFGNGIFVAVGAGGVIATSAD